MHFVMSYDLSATGAHRTEIEGQIQTILNNYRHVQRLTTFFIIHVDNNNQWENIRQDLTALSNRITESMHFIMSPLMDGGRYNGILTQGEWDEINNITNMQ